MQNNMNLYIDREFSMLFNAINTIHEIENEFNKPWGWIKIKLKIQYKKLKKEITTLLSDIENDKWNAVYLISLEKALKLNYNNVSKYLDTISVPDYDNSYSTTFISFSPLYINIKGLQVCIIEIINDSLDYTLMNMSSGNTIKLNHPGYEQIKDSIIKECKKELIKNLKRYLNRTEITEKEKAENFLALIQS